MPPDLESDHRQPAGADNEIADDRQFATLGLVLPEAIKGVPHVGGERPRQSRRGLRQIHTGQIRRCGTGAAVACFSHRRLRAEEEG
jgi:hypothetical protein